MGPRGCSRTRSVAGRHTTRTHTCPQSCLPGAGRVSVRPQRANKKPTRSLQRTHSGVTQTFTATGAHGRAEPTHPWSCWQRRCESRQAAQRGPVNSRHRCLARSTGPRERARRAVLGAEGRGGGVGGRPQPWSQPQRQKALFFPQGSVPRGQHVRQAPPSSLWASGGRS